jgi:DNA helicase-2/ATP-dependent DNA helicase PcrA
MVDDRAEVLFVDQRRKMLSHIKAGQPARTTFHHVFVDEAQDLLPVEYDTVLTRLVDDASSIVVGLDVTQALHTGSSFRRPGLLAGLNGTRRRWKIHELAGSYRLPIAICEALQPLAERILTDRQTVRRTSMSAGNETPVGSTPLDEVDPEDLVRPSSRKSALIGVRPIILAPANTADLAVQFAEVLSTHRPVVAAPGATLEVTYAESTADEARELNDRLAHQHNGNRTSISARVEKDTMLEIKGLERSVVLWNSKMAVNRIAASDVAEWVYTILTRTTGLLVIALSIGTPPEVRDLITCLRRDRLLFWDRAAEERFDAWNLNTRVLTG